MPSHFFGHKRTDRLLTQVSLLEIALLNEDDRTIRRCREFSKRWGHGGFYMLNLFGLRATDPRELKVHEDPVGPENMDYIHDMCRSCQTSGSLIVACWGNHGEFMEQGEKVREILPDPRVFGLTARKQPLHPLYLPRDSQVFRWEELDPH